MSKNILSKFRKSLEQSSKIVYDSKASPRHIDSCLRSLQRKEIQQINQQANHSYINQSYSQHSDNQKLLKRIPLLVSENDQLKEKIKNLQVELKNIRQRQEQRLVLSDRQIKCKTVTSQDSKTQKIGYQLSQQSRVSSSRLYQSSRQNYHRGKGLDIKGRNYSYFHYSQQKKVDFAQLQSQIVHFLQKQLQQLRCQNQQLLKKYNNALIDKKVHSEDIDKIKSNFETTIAKQQQLFNKKQQFYEQKLKLLQNNVSQAKQQNQTAKLQNIILTDQLAFCSKLLKAEKQKSKEPILNYKNKCVLQKQQYKFTEEVSHLWQIKQTQYNNMQYILSRCDIGRRIR